MKIKKKQRAAGIFCTVLMLISTLFLAQPVKANRGDSYSPMYLDSEMHHAENCTRQLQEEAFTKSGIQLSGRESSLKALKRDTQQHDQWLLEPDTRGFLLDLTDTAAYMAVTFPSLLPIQDIVQCRIFLAEDLSDESSFKYAEMPIPDDNVTYLSFKLTKLSPDTTYYYAFSYTTDTETVVSQFYSFTTLKSGGSSRDFSSVSPTLLSATEASFKVDVPSQYMKSYGYYWGTDWRNLQKYVIEDNINKEISEITFAPQNLTPDTVYYFSVYYETGNRTVVSKLYNYKTQPVETNISVTAPGQIPFLDVYSYKKKTMNVDWVNDEEADGYQIQYATDKKFKSAKTITITSWLTDSKRISKLKSKKRYYVRIRAYKKSAKGNIYGKWSKVKSCKVK